MNFYSSCELLHFSLPALGKMYDKHKRRSQIYQIIFYLISAVFFGLAAIIHLKTTNWHCQLFFGPQAHWLKLGILGICLLLASGALGLACSICPHQEAVDSYTASLKQYLHTIYTDLQFHSDPQWQDVYYQMIHTIDERRYHALCLIERLSSSKVPQHVKGTYVKEAIDEFNYKLYHLVQVFVKHAHRLEKNLTPAITH